MAANSIGAPTIGVLALQGAVREHQRAIERCGAISVPVKHSQDMAALDGFILPGGESTTIGKLISGSGLLEEIRRCALDGMPIFGTCAGLIMMAAEADEDSWNLLGLMDISAKRNAFGRQVDSFEADIMVKKFNPSAYRGVFIRAPWIDRAGAGVSVLARYQDKAVLAEQGSYLVSAFHPELTDDLRMHQYFLKKVKKWTREREIAPAQRISGTGL